MWILRGSEPFGIHGDFLLWICVCVDCQGVVERKVKSGRAFRSLTVMLGFHLGGNVRLL